MNCYIIILVETFSMTSFIRCKNYSIRNFHIEKASTLALIMHLIQVISVIKTHDNSKEKNII
jgi:hypothetical protein